MDANEQSRTKYPMREAGKKKKVSLTPQGNLAYAPYSGRMISYNSLNNFIYNSAKKVQI